MDSSFSLLTTALRLNGVGPIACYDTTQDFWTDRTRPGFRAGHILSVFEYAHTWTYRERHRDGDELAVLLTGNVDLLVDHGNGETAQRVHPGCGSIIRAGAWHRLRVHEPSTVLFITPVPAQTEHCEVPAES